MVDELLAGLALLPVVGAGREVEGADEQVAVEIDLLVQLRIGDQLVDEVLMPFEHCHTVSVPRPFGLPSPGRGLELGREARPVEERGSPLLRRRRELRKLRQVARLLRALEEWQA